MKRLFIYTVVLFAVALAAPGALATGWSNGGFIEAEIAGMQAQTDGTFLVGLHDPAELSTTKFIRFTPSTGIVDVAFSVVTTGTMKAVSPDGKALVQTGDSFAVFTLADTRPVDEFTIGNTPLEYLIQFTAEANEVLLVYYDKGSYALLRRDISAHTSKILPLEDNGSATDPEFRLSPDGKTLAALTRDNDSYNIEIWNTLTGVHKVLPTGITDPLLSSLVVNNNYAVYIDDKGAAIRLDLNNGNTERLYSPILLRYSVIALSADNILTGIVEQPTAPPHQQGIRHIVVRDIHTDITTGLFPLTADPDQVVESLEYSGNVLGVALSRGSECMDQDGGGTAYSRRVNFAFYDATTGRRLGSYAGNGHTGGITDIALSPDGRFAASTGTDIQTVWRDAATGELKGSVPGTGQLVFGDAATLLRAMGTSIETIDLKTQTVTASTPFSQGKITALHRSYYGTMIAAVTTSGITLLSYPELVPLRTLVSPVAAYRTVREIAFTTTGTVVALFTSESLQDVVVVQWNAATGTLLASTVATTRTIITHVELSPDGRSMILWDATAGLRGYVHSTDGTFIREIQLSSNYHLKSYFDSEFSRDGSLLYVIGLERYEEQEAYRHRQVLRRFAVYGSTSEVMGFSPQPGRAEALRILPDNTAAIYGFSIFNGSACQAGILQSTQIVPEPILVFAPIAVVFDTVYGGQSQERIAKLASGNTTPLIVTSIAVEALATGRGMHVLYNYSLPDTVQPGEERTLTVTLAPEFPQHSPAQGRIGNIILETANTYLTTKSISVYGTTIGPVVQPDIQSIAFGDVQTGTTAERTVVLSPGNDAVLAIVNLDLYDEDSPTQEFSVTADKPLPALLHNGDSVRVTVRYTPSVAEAKDLRLAIFSNDPLLPVRFIPITAQGVTSVDVYEGTALYRTTEIMPNPATSVAHVHFTTSAAGMVSIELFSVEGQLIDVVRSRFIDAGTHIELLSVESLPAGVYYCRVTTPSGVVTKSVVVEP